MSEQSRPWKRRPLQWLAKRALDYSAATAATALLAPAGVVVAAAIRRESEGGALFRQKRVGREGSHFEMVKLRTMQAGQPVVFNADGSTRVAAQDPRVTRIGGRLRGGLDELPQLLNVLRGEMSLVGPRPDMVEHERYYTEHERRKLAVRPGITSLAAVLGRNGVPWKQRMAIDVRYVERWSLGLDLRIIGATLCMPLGFTPFTFEDIVDALPERGALPLTERDEPQSANKPTASAVAR